MTSVRSESKRRATVWAVGTTLILTGFFLRRGLQRAGSPAGTAVRLFSIGSHHVRLYESPRGDEWLLSVAQDVTVPTGLRLFLSGLAWAPWSRRVVRPTSPPGSYLLTGSGFCRVWSVQADGWQDAHHLFGLRDAAAQLGHPLELDLRSRRVHSLSADSDSDLFLFNSTLPRPKPSLYRLAVPREDETIDEAGNMAEDGPSTPDIEIPGADGWPGQDQQVVWGRAGSRKVILTSTVPGEEMRSGLYGLSDDDAPRSLYLGPGGVPLAISRNGRTIFFERSKSLWRLDLRKPLPQLLDEVKVPALPDPPE
jgi:hypothetical protein